MAILKKHAAMKMVNMAPKMNPRGTPIQSRMSQSLPPGSPGTDIVQAFCAQNQGLVNATNVQGVGV